METIKRIQSNHARTLHSHEIADSQLRMELNALQEAQNQHGTSCYFISHERSRFCYSQQKPHRCIEIERYPQVSPRHPFTLKMPNRKNGIENLLQELLRKVAS